MAIVGEQLLQPESGMQRIDNSNINIKYFGNWMETNVNVYYNSSLKYSNDTAGKYEFYFYGTKLNIIANDCVLYSGNVTVKIDNEIKTGYSLVNKFPATETNLSKYCQRVLFSIDNLTKSIHKVEVSSEGLGTSYSLGLDAIDIDDDGYMIYCDDNGKLFYDVTPIMTSNTTPAPYVASASSVYDNYQPWKVFDGQLGTNGWASSNKQDYVILNFGKKIKISDLKMTNGDTSGWSTCMPNEFKISGSNVDSSYNLISEYTNLNSWKISESKLFNFNNIENYQYYKIDCKTDGVHVNISELRFLLGVDTPFYLIKNNINGKIYNYNEENNELVEVDDSSILNKNALENTCIYNLYKVIPLLDTLSNDLTIICNNDKKVIAQGIKTNKELIIGKNSFPTRVAKNIDYFKLDENATAKVIFSIDDGATWKTYNSDTQTFEDLDIAIPMDKEYYNFTDEEKIAWEEAKETALNQGIDSSILNTIDFNNLGLEKIRFGYVLTAVNAETMDKMVNLIWQFDSKGVMELVSPTEVKQQLFYSGVKLVSNIDSDMLKVNITYEGITGEGSSGPVTSLDIDRTVEEIQSDVDNIFI